MSNTYITNGDVLLARRKLFNNYVELCFMHIHSSILKGVSILKKQILVLKFPVYFQTYLADGQPSAQDSVVKVAPGGKGVEPEVDLHTCDM